MSKSLLINCWSLIWMRILFTVNDKVVAVVFQILQDVGWTLKTTVAGVYFRFLIRWRSWTSVDFPPLSPKNKRVNSGHHHVVFKIQPTSCKIWKITTTILLFTLSFICSATSSWQLNWQSKSVADLKSDPYWKETYVTYVHCLLTKIMYTQRDRQYVSIQKEISIPQYQ